MARIRQLLITLALVAAVAAILVPQALASKNQISIFEDDVSLHDNLTGTLATVRALGVNVVRIDVNWGAIAPDPNAASPPKGFNASDPGAYPAAGWSFYDQFVRTARADGLTVALTVTKPAPRWAEGAGCQAASHIPSGDRTRPSSALS